jgi:hypothetical protein
VISRVGAALAQFIAPVASSQAQEQIHGHDDQRRPANQKQDRKKDPKREQPKLEAVPTVPPKPAEAPAEKTAAAPPAAGGPSSGAQSFLQLLDVFQHGRGMFMRFFATRSYQVSIKGQKKGGKFRKGTMLDERVE